MAIIPINNLIIIFGEKMFNYPKLNILVSQYKQDCLTN